MRLAGRCLASTGTQTMYQDIYSYLVKKISKYSPKIMAFLLIQYIHDPHPKSS